MPDSIYVGSTEQGNANDLTTKANAASMQLSTVLLSPLHWLTHTTVLRFVVPGIVATGFSLSAAAQTATDYAFAARQFENMVSVTQSANTMPRLAIDGVAKLIGELSDQDRYLNNANYDVETLRDLISLCSNANRVVMAYALFEINERLTPTEDNAVFVNQVSALMTENIVEYQDELTLLQPFLFKCMEKQIPLLTGYIVSLETDEMTDVRVSGLIKARKGSFRTYRGAIMEMGNDALTVSYRRAVMAALAESAEEFASLLTVDQRLEILTNTKEKALADGEVHRHASTIEAAMSSETCIGICQLEIP